jgi:carbamoyl-phosphate synthase large subunit
MHSPPATLVTAITSAGRRVELLELFRAAGQQLGVPLAILAADANPELSPACQLADRSAATPRCSDPAFVPALFDLCREHSISLLVPTIDPELLPLAENRAAFERIGTTVAVSAPELVRIARDKIALANFLNGLGIASPKILPLPRFLENPSELAFPLMLKPASGSASIGAFAVDSLAQIEAERIYREDYVAQELWEGPEYTVNLFFDRSGLQCAVPHRRLEVRAGEVAKAVTERVPALLEISRQLGEALQGQAFGALCFQAILRRDGVAGVFDLNARFGGGYPLADRAGGKFAQWLLEISLGRKPAFQNDWRGNLRMLRYDSSVFVQG